MSEAKREQPWNTVAMRDDPSSRKDPTKAGMARPLGQAKTI